MSTKCLPINHVKAHKETGTGSNQGKLQSGVVLSLSSAGILTEDMLLHL